MAAPPSSSPTITTRTTLPPPTTTNIVFSADNETTEKRNGGIGAGYSVVADADIDSNEDGMSGLAIVRLGACGRCRVACDTKTRQLYGLPLLLFLLLLGASAAIVVNLQINERSSLKVAASRTGVTSSGLLERTLDRALSSAVFLGQTMRIFPDLVENNFTQLVQPLFNDQFLAVTNLQVGWLVIHSLSHPLTHSHFTLHSLTHSTHLLQLFIACTYMQSCIIIAYQYRCYI
jgi:hypothetical protein